MVQTTLCKQERSILHKHPNTAQAGGCSLTHGKVAGCRCDTCAHATALQVRALTTAALPAGRHSAVTLVMASRAAMARAVRRLSPVTRWHLTPRCSSAATTPRASGLSGSNRAIAAASTPFTATKMHVCPSLCVQRLPLPSGFVGLHSVLRSLWRAKFFA